MTVRTEAALWVIGILVVGAGFYATNASDTWASILSGGGSACEKAAEAEFQKDYDAAQARYENYVNKLHNELGGRAVLQDLLVKAQAKLDASLAKCKNS